jgi:hypothetical protein
MAPERLMGYAPEASADVYAHGMVLHHLFTNRAPPNCTENEIIDGRRPVFEETDRLPDKLKELIEKCWDGDATRRPTFTEILDKRDELLLDDHRAGFDEYWEYVNTRSKHARQIVLV